MDIYINKDYRQAFDELIALASLKKIKVSSLIGLAVQDYIRKINNSPRIIIEEEMWDDLLKPLSKEQILELDTLITKLNRKILERNYAKSRH